MIRDITSQRQDYIALSQKFLSLASQLVRRDQQAAAKSGSTSHVNCGPRNQQDQQLQVTISNQAAPKIIPRSHTTARNDCDTATPQVRPRGSYRYHPRENLDPIARFRGPFSTGVDNTPGKSLPSMAIIIENQYFA